MKTSNRHPGSLPEGCQAGLVNWVMVGLDQWVQLEGWLRWSACPLDGAVCRDHAQDPVFAPDTSKWQLSVLVLLFLVHSLPQLHTRAVIFSPLQFP